MKTHFVTLKSGLRIHTLIEGSKRNKKLVLLHGYPANCYLWRHCIPLLTSHFQVFVPDLPGHGESDKPLDVDYDLDFMVQFLRDYYDALGLAKPCLVGHDFGGIAGLGFVCRYSERVSQFVVMNTFPYATWPLRARILINQMRNPIIAWCLLTSSGFQYVSKYLLYDRTTRVTREMTNIYRKSWIKNKNSRKAFRHVIGQPTEKLSESRRNIQNISVPTLILWGNNDPLFPVSIARQLNQDIPNSKLVLVQKCGHFLQEDNPKQLVNHLLSFLND